MTDIEQSPEVATKAPESDAASGAAPAAAPDATPGVALADAAPDAAPDAEPIISGDTPAQTGASMGEHCTTDRPSPLDEEPSGSMIKLADVDCYISKPADYPQTPSRMLLLLSSGTGVHSKNNQIQADRFAAEGYLVAMPDQFNNDPAPVTRQKDIDSTDAPASPTTIEQIKLNIAKTLHGASATFQVDMWLARQTPDKCLPLLRKVIAAIHAEYADAVAHGGGIYAVGYCFGARYVLLLGGEPADKPAAKEGEAEGAAPKLETLVKAGAMAHGTQVQQADMKNCKAPVSLICVEEDPWFPDEIREQGKKDMEQEGREHELTMYPGVPHGFAVVGEYEEANIRDAQQKAFTQMLDWLKAH